MQQDRKEGERENGTKYFSTRVLCLHTRKNLRLGKIEFPIRGWLSGRWVSDEQGSSFLFFFTGMVAKGEKEKGGEVSLKRKRFFSVCSIFLYLFLFLSLFLSDLSFSRFCLFFSLLSAICFHSPDRVRLSATILKNRGGKEKTGKG